MAHNSRPSGLRRPMVNESCSRGLARSRCRPLVCVGRHDPQTPWPANAAIVAALPYGRLEVFDRSGHYPFVEEPERFAAVVGAFLLGRPNSTSPGTGASAH
jgi:pimeloyl-ACP methyl ester carboxylesterase